MDQDYITLTCVTTTPGVTRYTFFKNNQTLPTTGNTHTYTIAQAPLKTENGDYTCIAYFENVASDESEVFTLIGKK